MFSNGLDHAAATGYVDVPHPASIHDPGARGIDNERQMDDSFRTVGAQQLQKLVARALLGQVSFFEMGEGRCILWRMHVRSHHMKIGELLKHAESQLA